MKTPWSLAALAATPGTTKNKHHAKTDNWGAVPLRSCASVVFFILDDAQRSPTRFRVDQPLPPPLPLPSDYSLYTSLALAKVMISRCCLNLSSPLFIVM